MALVDEALPVFEQAGNDFALHIAYAAKLNTVWMGALMDSAFAAGERGVEHARRAGLPHRVYRLLPLLAAAQYHGTTPLPKLLEWLDELAPANLLTQGTALSVRSCLRSSGGSTRRGG